MQTYSDLLRDKVHSQITYQNLLLTNEWSIKRDQIINRDNKRCTKCKLSPTGSYAHFDEVKKEYSYITDDGSEYIQNVKNNESYIIIELISYKIYRILKLLRKLNIFNVYSQPGNFHGENVYLIFSQ